MKRSEINAALREAQSAFAGAGWVLPPGPRWDVTDFGLGEFPRVGLVLVNLSEEPEYCEKLMFAREKQVTPMHAHGKKKEDIICRHGRLALELWAGHPGKCAAKTPFTLSRNGSLVEVRSGEVITLNAGERITLVPGVYHAFWPEGGGCVIGEVSTANDDRNDNFFVDSRVGRFPGIIEDEPALARLVSEAAQVSGADHG